MGGLPTNRTVNGFAVSPADARVMLVATRDGLYRSTDAGLSWGAVGTELTNMATVTVNPKRPTEVYAATADGTIYRSTDGGTQWDRQK